MRIVIVAIAASTALAPQVVFANEGNTSLAVDETIVWDLPGVLNNSPDSSFRLEDLSAQEAELTPSTKKIAIEGYAAVWNKFTDADLFAQVRGVTSDVYVSVEVVDGLRVSAWNIQDIDPDPQVGDELYLSAAYELPIDDELTLTVEAGRSWTEGFNNIWIFTGTVQYRAVDFSVMEFVVDNVPRPEPEEGENATRFQLGYTLPPLKEVTSRVMLTHEQGFGLPTITTVGIEAELPLTNQWSLRGEVFAPLFKEAGDPRNAAVMVGLAFNF